MSFYGLEGRKDVHGGAMSHRGLLRHETRLSVIMLGDDDAMEISRAAGVDRAKEWSLHMNELDQGH